MDEIVNYIVDNYEFEIVPCSIPSSNFQYIKRNFYIWIMNKVSKRLFYFLRDKVSPIKFLNERPDGTIWLKRRMSNGELSEIEIKTIYLFDHSPQFKTNNDVYTFPKEYHEYLISLYTHDEYFLENSTDDTLQIDKLNSVLIDKYLYQIPELKKFNRNRKLEDILN